MDRGFLGWLDRWLAKRADERLAVDVRNNMVLLFAERAAHLVPNDAREYRERRHFDYAVATVYVQDLHLRFSRVRGELSICVAVPGTPTKWERIELALAWLDIAQGTRTVVPASEGSNDWQPVDRFLTDHWARIVEAAAASPVRVREFRKTSRDAGDAAIRERNGERLNREAADVLAYQGLQDYRLEAKGAPKSSPEVD